jgi:hypothetical protein
VAERGWVLTDFSSSVGECGTGEVYLFAEGTQAPTSIYQYTKIETVEQCGIAELKVAEERVDRFPLGTWSRRHAQHDCASATICWDSVSGRAGGRCQYRCTEGIRRSILRAAGLGPRLIMSRSHAVRNPGAQSALRGSRITKRSQEVLCFQSMFFLDRAKKDLTGWAGGYELGPLESRET